MKREYPERPIVGVGGIIFKEQSVLLVQRDKEPDKGRWTLPGGAVELGERLTEALIREIKEETSLQIEVGGLTRIIDRIIYDHEQRIIYHYVIIDYWGRVVSGLLRPGSDVRDARYAEIRDIENQGLSKIVVETILKAEILRKGSI